MEAKTALAELPPMEVYPFPLRTKEPVHLLSFQEAAKKVSVS